MGGEKDGFDDVALGGGTQEWRDLLLGRRNLLSFRGSLAGLPPARGSLGERRAGAFLVEKREAEHTKSRERISPATAGESWEKRKKGTFGQKRSA